jgi:prevent-host-death family protein
VGADSFRVRFGYWLERVRAGEDVLVTRRGMPLVRLSAAVPVARSVAGPTAAAPTAVTGPTGAAPPAVTGPTGAAPPAVTGPTTSAPAAEDGVLPGPTEAPDAVAPPSPLPFALARRRT